MKQPRSATATAILIAALTTGFAPTAGAAIDGNEVQELQREVNQLRAEVQSLQAVLLQAAELERKQSAVLNSTIDSRAAAAEPAAPPPAAPPAPAVIAREAAPPPAVSAAPEKKSRGGARNRRKGPSRSRSKATR